MRPAKTLSSLRFVSTGPHRLPRSGVQDTTTTTATATATMFDRVSEASLTREHAIRSLPQASPTLHQTHLPLSACGHGLAPSCVPIATTRSLLAMHRETVAAQFFLAPCTLFFAFCFATSLLSRIPSVLLSAQVASAPCPAAATSTLQGQQSRPSGTTIH